MARISWLIVLVTIALSITVERIMWSAIIFIVCASFSFGVRRGRKSVDDAINDAINDAVNDGSQETVQETEWMKVRRGETIRSFRKWLECDCGLPNEYCHTIVHEPLPKNSDCDLSRWKLNDSMSILMTVERERPNPKIGTREVILRRYSLLTSDIYSDILRIKYFKNPSPESSTWIFAFGSSAGQGIFDMVFGCQHRPWETVLLVDTHRQTYAQVYFAAPMGDRLELGLYRDEDQMNRLLMLYLIEDMHGNALHFEVVEHEIELARHPSKLFARQVRTVVTPIVGNIKVRSYYGFAQQNGFSLHGMLILDGNTIAECKHITFDRQFISTIRPADEVMQEWRASSIGQQMRAAQNDFVAMCPPEDEAEPLFMFVYGVMIFGVIGNVFARRFLRPPSLLFQTAEKICRRNPNADVSALKDEIGFDVFDGVLEEKKKPPMVIELSDDLSMLG